MGHGALPFWDHIWIRFASRLPSRPRNAVVLGQANAKAFDEEEASSFVKNHPVQPVDTSNRRRRSRAAAPHRQKSSTSARSPSPTQSPLRRNSDTSLPLKRELLLRPSAKLHVSAPKLPVVNRKEAVPINEDEQGEEDTPIPTWLSRLRDRRSRELEARTAGEGGKDSKEDLLVLGERVEPVDKDGKSKGHKISRQESQPEGQHQQNKQETGQVRLNLRSEGDFEKVTGISGAGEKPQTSRKSSFTLSLSLSHVPMRVGTAFVNLISLEGKPTTGEGSRVRNLLPLPLQHIGFDELVLKIRDLHAQAHGVSGWEVLLPMASNHLYLNCPSHSACRAPHGLPTL